MIKSENNEIDERTIEMMMRCNGVIIPEDHADLPKFDENGNLLDSEGKIIPDPDL